MLAYPDKNRCDNLVNRSGLIDFIDQIKKRIPATFLYVIPRLMGKIFKDGPIKDMTIKELTDCVILLRYNYFDLKAIKEKKPSETEDAEKAIADILKTIDLLDKMNSFTDVTCDELRQLRDVSAKASGKLTKFSVKCYICKKTGHNAAECQKA